MKVNPSLPIFTSSFFLYYFPFSNIYLFNFSFSKIIQFSASLVLNQLSTYITYDISSPYMLLFAHTHSYSLFFCHHWQPLPKVLERLPKFTGSCHCPLPPKVAKSHQRVVGDVAEFHFKSPEFGKSCLPLSLRCWFFVWAKRQNLYLDTMIPEHKI